MEEAEYEQTVTTEHFYNITDCFLPSLFIHFLTRTSVHLSLCPSPLALSISASLLLSHCQRTGSTRFPIYIYVRTLFTSFTL